MSIDGMAETWERMRGQVRDFYEQVRGPLLEGVPIPPNMTPGLQILTDDLLESSRTMRVEGADALSGASQRDHGRAADLLLAAAAIDALLATDLAVLAPPGAPSGSLEIEPNAETIPPEAALRDGEQLIDEVDGLFRDLAAAAGTAPADHEPAQLVLEAESAMLQLSKDATTPGDTLARGFIAAASLGAVPAVEVLGHVHLITALPEAGGLRARALGFVRQYVGKIRELLPLEWGLDTLAVNLEAGVSVQPLLTKAAGVKAANELVNERIMNSDPPPDQDQAEQLRAALTQLCSDYRGHTEWLQKGARRLRFFGGAVVHAATLLLGPPGYCVMPAVFLLAEGYVAYSLADRVDARRLGPADRVEGVVRIVRRIV